MNCVNIKGHGHNFIWKFSCHFLLWYFWWTDESWMPGFDGISDELMKFECQVLMVNFWWTDEMWMPGFDQVTSYMWDTTLTLSFVNKAQSLMLFTKFTYK
jgi:hypothetical protein